MKKEEEAVTQMFSNYLLCHTFFQPMIEIFHCSHKLDNCVKQNITKLMQVKMPRNNQLEDLDNTTQKKRDDCHFLSTSDTAAKINFRERERETFE